MDGIKMGRRSMMASCIAGIAGMFGVKPAEKPVTLHGIELFPHQEELIRQLEYRRTAAMDDMGDGLEENLWGRNQTTVTRSACENHGFSFGCLHSPRSR